MNDPLLAALCDPDYDDVPGLLVRAASALDRTPYASDPALVGRLRRKAREVAAAMRTASVTALGEDPEAGAFAAAFDAPQRE